MGALSRGGPLRNLPPQAGVTPMADRLDKGYQFLSAVNDILTKAAAKIPDKVVAASGEHLMTSMKAKAEARREAKEASKVVWHAPPPQPVAQLRFLPPPAEREELDDLESKQSLAESKQSLGESKSDSKSKSKPESKPESKQVCGIDGCGR